MTAASSTTIDVDGRAVRVTSLDKPYFPAAGVSKGDVIEYYRRIAPIALPYLAGRPIVLQRFPDGVDAPGFFQKNTPAHTPAWIRRCEMSTVDGGTTTYSVIDDAAGLVHLVNQGAITLHALLAGAAAPERPVEVVFDLDPSTDDLGPVRSAAAELRAVLDELGLAPRVKSSGSRGLHVVVDVIDERPDFGLTATFARRVAEHIRPRGPFTLEHRKRDRGDRLYLDVLRNGPASHAVAPYSLRPLPDAPVAAALEWDEALDATFHPRRITIANVFRRLGQIDDPWVAASRPTTTIAAALRALDR